MVPSVDYSIAWFIQSRKIHQISKLPRFQPSPHPRATRVVKPHGSQTRQIRWLPTLMPPQMSHYSKGSFQRSEHTDVLLPHLELDFPAGNSVGFSGIQLQKPQPTMGVILSPNCSTSETKRKPVSRLSKKQPQVPNSCSTSQFSQTITQELPPSTNISNAKQNPPVAAPV